MKAFVTGACGFIGSHLAEALVAAGHDVTAMGIYSARDTFGWLDEIHPPVGRSMRKVRGDVHDAELMRRLIKRHDIVFHLAALGSVPYSYAAPRSVFETNAGGTLNVLEACRDAEAKLVHTSTSEVYGTALYTPQDENHPLQAQSPYAASKIAADKLVEAYTNTFDMDTVTLRPFNTYGPRQSERAVIPAMIRQLLDPRCKEIRVGDCFTERDFVFVADTVRAFMAAAMLDSGIWNVGTGMSISIAGVGSILNQIMAPPKLVVPGDQERLRPERSEVRKLEACAQPFMEATGWKPTMGLREGLQHTLHWWATRTLTSNFGMVA